MPLAASARTLEVGADRDLKSPSAAAAIAKDGDTVRIDPGDYLDCAIWRANGLTIEGGGAVISDKACGGKALFIIAGNATTIRGLTLTRIRVADGNGAGIRLEGRDLIVEQVRFVNNQVGLLAGDAPGSHIHITESAFLQNGACSDHGCVGALLVGGVTELVVDRSVFAGTKAGHHIVSGAARTAISSSRITDGPDGTAGYGVQKIGDGELTMQNNVLEKGPNTGNRRAEILVGGDGWGSAGAITLRRNQYENNSGSAVPLLLNWTSAVPVLEDNRVTPPGLEVSRQGIWLYRLRYALVTAKDALRHLAGHLRDAF